jgi:hypothetical protein
MRPVQIISLLVLAAAIGVAGCAADTTAVQPPTAAVPIAAPAAPAAPAAVGKAPVTKLPVSQQRTSPAPPPAPAPKPKPASPAIPRLYFDTPQAAMRYLAAAYNRNDLVALGHVTTPVARVNLVAMRRTAVNLRLVDCTLNAGRGDYLCSFTHEYPPKLHQTGVGHAHFTAAPADKHGWYMTVLNDCS